MGAGALQEPSHWMEPLLHALLHVAPWLEGGGAALQEPLHRMEPLLHALPHGMLTMGEQLPASTPDDAVDVELLATTAALVAVEEDVAEEVAIAALLEAPPLLEAPALCDEAEPLETTPPDVEDDASEVAEPEDAPWLLLPRTKPEDAPCPLLLDAADHDADDADDSNDVPEAAAPDDDVASPPLEPFTVDDEDAVLLSCVPPGSSESGTQREPLQALPAAQSEESWHCARGRISPQASTTIATESAYPTATERGVMHRS